MFILPVRDIAKIALRMGVRYSGVSNSGYGQLVSGTRETSITTAAFSQGTTHDDSTLLLRLLLLDQAGVGGAAG